MTEAELLAAREALQTVSVTGTNGKTTVTSMVASIVAASGEVPARVTTVGAWVGDRKVRAETLEDEFFAMVAMALSSGVRTLAVETTSKALMGGFASRWPPRVAVFTNLTRDHLDLHGSPEAYLAAKAQLFLALPAGGHAILCADDPASALLSEIIPAGVTVWRYSVGGQPAELVATDVTLGLEWSRCTLQGLLQGPLELSVAGEVHVGNALGAALAALALGYPEQAIRAGLRAFLGAPGRFELVSREPLVVVDYAHTPDGLTGTLRTARRLVSGRILLVFGCGGERDQGKRPEMGQVADAGADLVVLTSDNPRGEDPAAIAAMVLAGREAPPRARWVEQPDRSRAIALALSEARPGDIVVVAGKGHEAVQEVGDEILPFSDRAEIERWLAPGAIQP